MVVDADRYGAIVVDARGPTAIGVMRDGTVAWRSPLDPAAPIPVSCLARCPDAVLAVSAASAGSATVPDPDPVVIDADGRRALAVPAGSPEAAAVKRQVLAADSATDFVLATAGTAGRATITLHRAGEVHRVPVGGARSTWAADAAGRHALVVTTIAAARAEARWFVDSGAGWRPEGRTVPVTGNGSCVAPAGDRAIVLGQRPEFLDRGGSRTPVTDLGSVGTCAFAAAGGIAGELLQRPAGPLSRLRAFDATGAVTWSADVTREARVTADPTGARVAYVAGGELRELDPGTGAALRTLPGVEAAHYDGDGSLVAVTPTLEVTWLG